MKNVFVFLLVLISLLSAAKAATSVNIYEADGITPFDGRDIMVGTELTIVVSSDTTDYWSGGLFIAGQDRALAALSARDFDPNMRDWTGSHYEDAGEYAKVTAWTDSEIWGFDLYGSDSNSVPGKWFIIDYEAIGEGDPNVWVYDYSYSFDDPNSLIFFSHVPSRDFNNDDVVNIADYALLASYWQVEDCNEPNWCDNTDINTDGDVDLADLALFTDYWLWGIPQTPVIPEAPEYPEDPNVTFSIVDANGLSEITVDVDESITLYIDMATEGVDVYGFNLEVNISDPNLGSIDNWASPSGTARILASPRTSSWDDWGPGIEQEEGIQLFGASSGSAMSDGHLASFVFTCDGQGDVTLKLLNWTSTYAKLEDMTIHQVDPYSQQMMSGGMSMMQESTQTQAPQKLSLDETVRHLEEIWLADDGIQEIISEDRWQEFINKVKVSGQREQ